MLGNEGVSLLWKAIILRRGGCVMDLATLDAPSVAAASAPTHIALMPTGSLSFLQDALSPPIAARDDGTLQQQCFCLQI